MKLDLLRISKFRQPWLGGIAAVSALVLLSWMNFETGAVFGFATLYLVPIVWGGLTLPLGWSVSVGGLASVAWLFAALNTGLPHRINEEDWLTIPLIYPSLSFLLSHLSTTRRKLEDSLRREYDSARKDVLTGLLNRRGFFETIESLSRRWEERSDFTMAFLDLDRFKKLNDGMGHEVGDSLLSALGAEMLKIDQGALAARIGGDEFVLLLPRGAASAAKERLVATRKTLNAICARFSREVTVSMGAAHFAKALPQPDMALRIIDVLMYAAKNAGKDKLYFADLEPKDWEEVLKQPNYGRIKSRLQAVAEEFD